MGGAPDISRPAPPGGRGPRTLAARLEAEGALDPGEVATLGAAVATELAEMHQRGEVVGAVRPDSIVMDGGPESAHIVAEGWRAGLYRSPEQVEGATPTGASDVYSLGVVVLHALSGLAPPPNGRAATMADFPTALSSVPGHLDRRWQWVLQGMTTRSADLRLSAALAAAALTDLDRRHHRAPRAGLVPVAQSTVGAAPTAAAAAGIHHSAHLGLSSTETTLEPTGHRGRVLRRPVAVAAVGLVLVVSAAGALTARYGQSDSRSEDPDLVVVQELASTDSTVAPVKPTTTTTTTAPTGDGTTLVVQSVEGEGSAFGASLGDSSTFRPLRISLEEEPKSPDFAFVPPSSFAPPSFSSPTPTVPLRPPTTLTPPTTRPPTTTTPPTTQPPTTTAPPTTQPPTTTTPPTTQPPTTTTPPTTQPPTTTAPPTTQPPTTTAPPTTVPIPLPPVTVPLPLPPSP